MGIESTIQAGEAGFSEGIALMQQVAALQGPAAEDVVVQIESEKNFNDDDFFIVVDSNKLAGFDLDDAGYDFDLLKKVNDYVTKYFPEDANKLLTPLPESFGPNDTALVQQLTEETKQKLADYALIASIPDEGFVNDIFGDLNSPEAQSKLRLVTGLEFVAVGMGYPDVAVVTFMDGSKREVNLPQPIAGPLSVPDGPSTKFQLGQLLLAVSNTIPMGDKEIDALYDKISAMYESGPGLNRTNMLFAGPLMLGAGAFIFLGAFSEARATGNWEFKGFGPLIWVGSIVFILGGAAMTYAGYTAPVLSEKEQQTLDFLGGKEFKELTREDFRQAVKNNVTVNQTAHILWWSLNHAVEGFQDN